MATTEIKVETQFSQPIRQVIYMSAVLLAVAAGVYVAYPSLAPVFTANPYLNGLILFVFFLGVVACFWQVIQLFSSVAWIEGFAQERMGHDMSKAPGLLATLAGLLRQRGTRLQISTASARSIQDSVAVRMEEARDITRYIINTLIFLGLLGTFYGLATTVPAVVDTIRSLDPGQDEQGMAVFGRLIGGLEDQLAGMGTAFASSLLGLAGSLVVGLLELFAGHGQNRFYRELEEWLSTITRIGITSGDGDETIDQYSLAAVLDHMNYQVEQLQGMVSKAEAARAESDAHLGALTDAMKQMAQQVASGGATSSALERVAQGQENIVAVLQGSSGGGDGGGLDAESRMRIRSIDVQLLKIFEEMSSGRQAEIADLREDITALTRALRQLNRMAQASQAGQQGSTQPQDDG